MEPLTAIEFKTPLPGPEPGLLHIGYAEQAPGDWVPLYGSQCPEGKPSINTPEGWNALAERMAQ